MKRSALLLFVFLFVECVYHDLSVDEPPTFTCDAATISWQNDVLPIMQTSCAQSGCHDGISRLDWADYDEVKEYANAIKQKTQDRSMPFDGPLPQDQIDIIACWVNNGALNN
jgi:hypothetical protein